MNHDVVERLLADPPVVHPMAPGDATATGVWSSEAECYRFLADRVGSGARTLETGCGLSTVLFAALGCDHTCVTPAGDEVARVTRYCADRRVDLGRVRFEIGSSHEVLPRLSGPLDVVFVDGAHGFPLPIVDWFYAGTRLVSDGLLVIDDASLPAVVTLLRFVDRDPRWRPERRGRQWAAYRRTTDGPLAEDWTSQPFYVDHPPGARTLARRLAGRARRERDRLRRRR